jgi:DNA-binding NarL/FixJ family response regulator
MSRVHQHPDQMGHHHVVRDRIPVLPHLCNRHLRIWRQLVIGGSDKEIAQRSGLARRTVTNALSELYGLLELNPSHSHTRHSRTLATLWGMEIMHQHPEAFRDAESRRP